ncbi:MAG: nucleotidyltransferase domain-containing protein [Bdellovibrionaceae bacterium]|nr:nucleotidyltransferase domain-containing protein [Pseudobdellovibrionaceae bacterium]
MQSSPVAMKFGLTEKELHILDDLLIKPLKKYSAQVWIFGSRARGTYSKFSDIDILFALPNEKNYPQSFLFQIKDALESSDLPYKVDVVNEKDLANSYRANVLKERILL